MGSSSDILKEKTKDHMAVAIEKALHVLQREEDSRLVNIRQPEIPQLEQASQRCIAQAIGKLRGAQRLTRKLEQCHKLEIHFSAIS